MKNPYRFLLLILLCYQTARGQSAHADCADAYVLCDKTPVVIDAVPDAGELTDEIGGTACFKQNFPESNSAWFKWTVASEGTLEFSILPLNEQDDIDFVVYRLSGDCAGKQEVRCMLAGKMLGEDNPNDETCLGATGLRIGAENASQGKGCADGANNFLLPLNVLPGASYALFVHNFRSFGGFLLEMGGTCTFKAVPGPCKTTETPVLHNLDKKLVVSAVQPNPVEQNARVLVQATEAFSGVLMLADVHGRLLESRNLEIQAGDNSVPLDVHALSPGVYFVKMRFGDRIYLSRFYKG